MSKQFYITTAIDYVNGHPHLGHAYEKVITDVIARGHRSLGNDAFFLTGSDEHGQKVEQAAVALGKDPQVYCDELAKIWAPFVARLNCSINDFIRTTEPRHKEVVQAILTKLHQEDHFYRETYSGWYSEKEETFLTDRDRLEDGTFAASWGKVVELKEDNYYFKLGRHQQWLIDYINDNPDFIFPDYRRNEVLGFLNNHKLEDLCISRPVSRMSWGIPLPFDPEFVTYVWFDALVNYISSPASKGDALVRDTIGLPPLGGGQSVELWPADAHVVGKDIVKFHAVYWPIMLKAIGLPMPGQIVAHGWWQKDGDKISKSTGNIVDPIEVIEEWGLDAFRYYVTRELAVGPDGNWTDAGFENRYNAELANGLGNLVNRSLSMLKRYRESRLVAVSDELATEAKQTIDRVVTGLKSTGLQDALKAIWEFIATVNSYIDRTAPFKMAKDPGQSQRLDEVLYNLVESCRIIGVLVWPVLPDTAEKMFVQLNISESPAQLGKLGWGGLKAGHTCNAPEPLFPRKDLEKAKQ